MKNETNTWSELIKLTQGKPIEIEKVRIKQTGISLSGRFELPPLVQMTDEDQVFVSAFLRSHGSIKEMERLFGISYPTVKARLSHIAEQLPFVETVESQSVSENKPELSSFRKQVLDRLADGEIDATEATKLLRKRGDT